MSHPAESQQRARWAKPLLIIVSDHFPPHPTRAAYAVLVIILVVAIKDGKVIGNPIFEENVTRCSITSGAM
jgi:hypothetical protein